MIKYCFCFFLCVLTLNGAYEVKDTEEKIDTVALCSQPSSSCHPFFYIEGFYLPKNLPVTIICNQSTGQIIQFNSPFRLAKYLHACGAFPPLKMHVESEIAENLANLSELLLPLVSPEIPSPGQKLRLNPRSTTDRNLMNLTLVLSLHSFTTPLDSSIQQWKMNTLLKALDELWENLKTEKTTKQNYAVRKMLARVVDPYDMFAFEKCFQQTYPALTAWADKNNTSKKPAGAVITMLLMLACTEWQAPPPVPMLIFPSQIKSSTSFSNLSDCTMSSRRARTIEKYKPFGISSGHSCTRFSNEDRRAKLYDEMHKDKKLTIPRSPSVYGPSPFHSTLSLPPAETTRDFYIADDEDDGTE